MKNRRSKTVDIVGVAGESLGHPLNWQASASAFSTGEGITMALGVGVVCCAVVMAAPVARAVLSRRRSG